MHMATPQCPEAYAQYERDAIEIIIIKTEVYKNAKNISWREMKGVWHTSISRNTRVSRVAQRTFLFTMESCLSTQAQNPRLLTYIKRTYVYLCIFVHI